MYQRDLGVPFVSFNTRTGHRSSAPEDCGRFVVTLPQGPVPVSGVFPVGVALAPSGDWDSGNPAFAISRGSPGAPLSTPGHDRRFPGMLFSPFTLSDHGSAIRSRDISSRPCPLRERYNAAPRGAATTRTARTDHSINTRPRAALPCRPERPFGRCDEIDSLFSYTSICRSHNVTEFSAPTRRPRPRPATHRPTDAAESSPNSNASATRSPSNPGQRDQRLSRHFRVSSGHPHRLSPSLYTAGSGGDRSSEA